MVCRRCVLDNVFSNAVPCQLAPSIAAPGAEQHCCTVNFNADGTLWACVPAACLLTGCTTTNCSPDTEAVICDELASGINPVLSWSNGQAQRITVAEPKVITPPTCFVSATVLNLAGFPLSPVKLKWQQGIPL